MSVEALPESTFELPPDVLMANRLVWHGLQAFINPAGYDIAQPRLVFTDFTQPGAPIETTLHPNGIFENSDRPWAYLQQRNLYPNYAATQITLARVQANLPVEVEFSGVVPQVMINLEARSSLGALPRTDLDDAERRYLQRTQYLFWQNRSALRQDVFDTGDPKKHLVARRPSAEELKKLHGEMFTHDTCVCELSIRGLYQARPPRAPQRGLLRFFQRNR